MHASKSKTKARSVKLQRLSGAAENVSKSHGNSRLLSHGHGGFYASGPVVSLSQVQAKFTIGKANDPYEREADTVADHVVSGKQAPPITPVPASGLGSVAQMQQSAEEAEAEPPQPQLIQQQTEEAEEAPVQPQLIQRETEESETEAELPQTRLLQRQPEEDSEEQAPPQPQLIQREAEATETEEDPPQTQLIQRQPEEEPEEQALPQAQLLQLEAEANDTEEQPPQTQRIQRQSEEDEEETVQTKSITNTFSPIVQRQAEPEEDEEAEPEKEEEEEPVQTKPINNTFTPLVQRQPEEEQEEESTVQAQHIQRECENCRESAEKPVQTKAQTDNASDDVELQGHSNGSPKTISNIALSGALAQSGMGESLSSPVRNAMESSTGLDFSSVRIHTDGAAHQANRAIKARAFTHGSDIWLGRGESQNDRRLMAHELTHVVQQNSLNKGVQKIQRKPSAYQLMQDGENVTGDMQDEQGEKIDETNIPQTPLANNRQVADGSQEESQNDTAVGNHLAAEKIPETKGRGDSAAQDNPAAIRLPVDQDPNAEEVPEEPSTEDLKVQLKTLASAPLVQRPALHVPLAPAPLVQGPVVKGPVVKGPATLSTRVADVTQSAGMPLPNAIRRFMGVHLGVELGGIQLHYDARSSKLARSFNAKAFTHGEHIVFGSGQYQPDTPQGKHLIAHEITHVLQQRHLPQNSAVNLLQRQEEDCPPVDPLPEVEVIPSPVSPYQDPAYQKTKYRVKNRAKNQSQHGTGDDKSASANSAAEVKAGEKKSHGQKAQVGEMDAQAKKPPVFDKKAFTIKVLDQVKKVAPKTVDDYIKFASRGKADNVKAAVTGQVKQSQKKSQAPLDQAARKEPGAEQSPRTATTLKVELPGKQPGSVRADRSMPPPKTESEVDFQTDTTRTENILKEACVTREYMDKHNDPELKAGTEAQDQLKQSTSESPQQYREEEASTLAGARVRASSQGKQAVAKMFGERSMKFDEVGNNQQNTKTENEDKRDTAASEIDGIFKLTQTTVQERLKKLDSDVETTFDLEAGKASQKFQSFVDQKAKSLKKSAFDSLVEIVGDFLFGPPPRDAEKAYESGRRTFVRELTAVIEKIAGLVETGLLDARKIVAKGKLDVKTKLDSLGTGLDTFKKQKSEEMNDRFRSLEGEITKKQANVIQGLANRYVKTLKAAKKAEKNIRDKYKNIVDRAKDVYHKIKDAVLGWIEKLKAVVGGAAGKIIRQPGKFLSNLGAGIVQGFTMFMNNIGKNIQGAVVEWLTGNMSGTDISLPKTFDTRGIIGFLLELVGLGVANIKKIARKVFGAAAVSLIEKGVAGAEKIKKIFDILATDGAAGLFKFLAAEFEKMKGKVMAEAGKAVAEGLVVAGIKKALGLISGLVSGGIGSVITIVLTIIDVVLWIRDNAARIAELVSTIAGMAMAILNGQVAAIAAAINNVLKRLLPLVLGFVGALVGIGGVVSKIQKIFKAIKKPATKAITKLFRSFKKLVKKLIAKVKKKFGKGKGKGKKKLSSRQVVSLVMRAMKRKTRSKVPGEALAEKQSQAKSLLSKYQPRLKRGRLKILILDRSATDVQEDAAVDFDVSASPGRKGEAKLPINVEDVGAIRKRFAHARSLKKFTGESGFTITDWGSTFKKLKLKPSTHQKDMSFGVSQKIINRQEGRLYFKSKVRDATIVLRGAAEIQSSGASYPKFKKGQFGIPLITRFLKGRKIKGVPPDSYKKREDLVEAVANRAERAGVLSKARNKITWILTKYKHVSKFAIWKGDKFVLIKKFIGKVREKLYGGFTQAVKNLRTEYTKFTGKRYKITGPPGKIRKDVEGKMFDKEDIPTIEHKTPVVQHWVKTGRNKDQSTRKTFYNDTTRLIILPRSINSKEGAALKERYGEEVGKEFRGPGE